MFLTKAQTWALTESLGGPGVERRHRGRRPTPATWANAALDTPGGMDAACARPASCAPRAMPVSWPASRVRPARRPPRRHDVALAIPAGAAGGRAVLARRCIQPHGATAHGHRVGVGADRRGAGQAQRGDVRRGRRRARAAGCRERARCRHSPTPTRSSAARPMACARRARASPMSRCGSAPKRRWHRRASRLRRVDRAAAGACSTSPTRGRSWPQRSWPGARPSRASSSRARASTTRSISTTRPSTSGRRG